MNNFREGLNALREISDPEKAKLILEKITGKKLADYEGIDALVGALMGYYNEELKNKQNKQDSTLKTIAKEIVPAINEIDELAKKDKGERLPIGTIVPFVTDVIPLGYLLCDGREITKSEYSELYDLLPFGRNIDEKLFRSLAKNEVPIMTSNTQDNFVITTSSEYSIDYQGWKAFDRKNIDDRTSWVTKDGIKEGWVKIMYPKERAISKFILSSRKNHLAHKIKSVIFYGITGEGTEEQLVNETFSTSMAENETKIFELPFQTKQYKGFKINITNDESDPYASIGELELYTVDISQFPNANQDTSKKYLPDLRDMFLRGNKQGRQLLSWQNDDNKKHNHRKPLENIKDVSVQNSYKDLKLASEPITYYNDPGVLNDNGYGTPINQETFTETESRPNNISVNYIIKAKNISSEDTVSPVIDEVNTNIENNRKGLSDLKAEYENHLRGLSDIKILYQQTTAPGGSGTRTLNETIKNFKEIEIEVMTISKYKTIYRLLVDSITFDDNVSASVYNRNNYICNIYGEEYSVFVFRTNGINIDEKINMAYVYKIRGIGRIGGF